MTTVDDIMYSASYHLGVNGTNNIFNQWYWGHPCYDASVYPWCACFQSYIANENQSGTGFQSSASVSGIVGQLPRIADEDARRGDLVAFNWDGRSSLGWMDHIGIVEWFDHSTGYFGTIEGNTDGAPGGLCARRTRYNYGSYFTAFFRPTYSDTPSGGSTGTTPSNPTPPTGDTLPVPDLRYRVYTDKSGWLPEMVNHFDSGGSTDTYAGDGTPIKYLAIDMSGWYQVKTAKQGWLPTVSGYNTDDLENGCAGDGSEIQAIRCYYDTQDPNATGWLAIEYAAANVGGSFLANMIDLYDASGYGDDYAGDGGNISAFRARLIRV